MKSNRLYLLLVILSACVLSALSVEETSQQTDSATESRRRTNAAERNDQRLKQKNRKYENDIVHSEDDDDFNGFLSGYADNRYTASSGSEGNYRTRSRWQPQQPQQPQQAPVQQQQQQQQQQPPQFLSKLPFLTTVDSTETDDWSENGFLAPIAVNIPSMPFVAPQTVDHAPTCYSLVDSQYPIFADVCGAVPQARYSLPNMLGLHERWQLAQLLTNLVGSSTEAGCTRSLRLLVCPVLFPPCQSRQDTSPPVLPCQSYCRAVKSRCSIPALDALSCDALPYSSDICPTNQAYGSFIPPVAQPSPVNNGPSPSNYQVSRALASLQSLLAAQSAQAQSNQQASFPLPDAQPQYNPAFLPSPNRQSSPLPPLPPQQQPQQQQQQQQQPQQGNPLFMSTKTAQVPASPALVNARHPYPTDTLSGMFAELSGQPAGYPQGQSQRYISPLVRASPTDPRYANLVYPRVAAQVAAAPVGVPSGVSSLVKA